MNAFHHETTWNAFFPSSLRFFPLGSADSYPVVSVSSNDIGRGAIGRGRRRGGAWYEFTRWCLIIPIMHLDQSGRRLGTSQWIPGPKRLERYLQTEFWSVYGGWHAGHPQSSLTIKHYNTRVFLPYMAAPSGHKFGFTQSYGRSYGGIVPVFIKFTGSRWVQN